MKKYLAIFLALTMVLTFAVSCGNGEEPEETPKSPMRPKNPVKLKSLR